MMKTILQKINELNQMIVEGNALEGFERFYHDEVVMQENESPPTKGKVANLIREFEFFNSITEFRGAKPLAVSAGENVSMVEWHFDYTHKDWGVRNYKQISVQQWADGKIIYEKFYHGI